MTKYVKTYLNKSGGKKITFANGGEILKVSILESELSKLPRSTSNKGDVYVNFELSASKTPTEYTTHSVYFSEPEGAPKKAVTPSTPTNDAADW